ncbi:VOC family protein [Sulfitobacter donghicola]|uniref:Glyoxalase n=1 Tax=Sulfitobacter donghicola DSW-25 = KCTC 12864 = JCM 14565 TaxID=1300350 RepID=A0A073IEJ6_9RHOB|nr:VOC family protein [Sulfitobacter donghicola]KEJ88783.1 glyoxalase [Sulfitobacter donghicola DSW-25 = KCTC 12864 = JCM 14565]KIN68575.1 Glyoxalase/bleomycin resistance protein domain-containing protein [Sulfitobacter donghicola DSW-25 = KCTC 12864 = JCM 14565]
MAAQLEHVNLTVSDPLATAAWMKPVFGWHIRWQGEAISGGYSVHVGTADQYVAIYRPEGDLTPAPKSYNNIARLNHIAVVVSDLEAVEEAVRNQGFRMGEHYDYEPGRRFYFYDPDGIEFEVVQYD